jgi:hypothetical protein
VGVAAREACSYQEVHGLHPSVYHGGDRLQTAEVSLDERERERERAPRKRGCVDREEKALREWTLTRVVASISVSHGSSERCCVCAERTTVRISRRSGRELSAGGFMCAYKLVYNVLPVPYSRLRQRPSTPPRRAGLTVRAQHVSSRRSRSGGSATLTHARSSPVAHVPTHRRGQ